MVFKREYDPHADSEEAKKEYGIDLVGFDEMKDLSAVVIAVGHDEFRHLTPQILSGLPNNVKLVVDVKSRFDRAIMKKAGIEIIRI